jgi:hypothetical protein
MIDKAQLARLAAWWAEMPEDALDDPVNPMQSWTSWPRRYLNCWWKMQGCGPSSTSLCGRKGGREFPPGYLCACAMP